jgi:hypothetical protein
MSGFLAVKSNRKDEDENNVRANLTAGWVVSELLLSFFRNRKVASRC